jgi:hypothetical protein
MFKAFGLRGQHVSTQSRSAWRPASFNNNATQRKGWIGPHIPGGSSRQELCVVQALASTSGVESGKNRPKEPSSPTRKSLELIDSSQPRCDATTTTIYCRATSIFHSDVFRRASAIDSVTDASSQQFLLLGAISLWIEGRPLPSVSANILGAGKARWRVHHLSTNLTLRDREAFQPRTVVSHRQSDNACIKHTKKTRKDEGEEGTIGLDRKAKKWRP